MWEVAEHFKIILGGYTFIDTPKLIVFRDEPLFQAFRRDSDGTLGIDFDVYDANKAKVATIRNSKVVQGDAAKYDIVREASRHAVTEKSTGKSLVSITRKTANAELEVTVDTFLPDGQHFIADPMRTNLGPLVMTGITIKNSSVGIKIK